MVRYVESVVAQEGGKRLKRFRADGAENSSWLILTLDTSGYWLHYFSTTDEATARRVYAELVVAND